MDGSQFVTEAARPRGTSGQVGGKLRHDWPIDEREFDIWTVLPSNVEDQGLPLNRHCATLIINLAKIIGLALVLIATLLAFNFLILWIASARVIEQVPF
ncbi:MAG TPA: hypothetical protein VGR70_15485 [Stellaceae bacterium]|nr:hypothetical protein [Stellaceae bacterium]